MLRAEHESPAGSANSNDFWPELDEFEGAQYTRVPVAAVLSGGGTVEAYVYVLSPA